MNQIKEKIKNIKNNLSSLNEELDSLCDFDIKNYKYIDNLRENINENINERIVNLDIEIHNKIGKLEAMVRVSVCFVSFVLIIVLCSIVYGNINTIIYGIITFILMIQIITLFMYK